MCSADIETCTNLIKSSKMENLEVFDKNGKALRIADVMRSFLRDNLAIQISTSRERDYGDEYTVIEVSISLEGEEICKSCDSVR